VETVDLAVVGAGAAGLMAGIQAASAASAASTSSAPAGLRVVVLEGAKRPGAKILVSGGGRCNVTHERVGAEDFNGSSRHAIAKILRSFDLERTLEFFRALGVVLEREPTGKLFPLNDQARSVLDALLRAARDSGVEVRSGCRVDRIRRDPGSGTFEVGGPWGSLTARRVILATGGQSLPKSGSDGFGYELARRLGHSVSDLFPALVPLTLEAGSPLLDLSGISAEVVLEVRDDRGKKLASAAGALLLTHFGISGPAVLDISRHWIAARRAGAEASLWVNWLPETPRQSLEEELLGLGAKSVGGWLQLRFPDRLGEALCGLASVDPAETGARLPREGRKALVRALADLRLPVSGDRGYNFAEATAGGVPLSELVLSTLESRRCPGLHLCGEICDVDGRIGGFNFQWAWSSGAVAGRGAAEGLAA